MVCCQSFLVKKWLRKMVSEQKPLVRKNIFVGASMMEFGSERWAGERSHQLPGSVEKNHGVPRSILPGFELETHSDMCDTKFLKTRFCKSDGKGGESGWERKSSYCRQLPSSHLL